MSPLENYTRNAARRWKVLVAFTVLGALLAAAWSFGTSTTTWTATAALTTQSQERAPEQDAVLALGYVNYFNQASYQQLLRGQTRIPAGVTLEAQTGATSPILYITATAPLQKDARDAAALAAEAFREDVRTSLVEERRQAAADLQAQVDANTELLGQRGYNEAVVLDQIRSLQGRITDIQADNTNLLKQLQPEPGVASTTPSRVLAVVAGACGGLVIGVLVALLLALVDRRLRNSTDVRLRTGLDTLAEFRSDMDAESRGRVAATLVNSLSMTGGRCRLVLAVAAPRRTSSTREVAMQIASTAVGRRAGALLVRADLRDPATAAQDPMQLGLVDVLEGRRDVLSATGLAPNGVGVLAPGYARGRHLQSLLDPDRVVELVNSMSEFAGVVVIELPPVLEAAEAQILAAAAERVVLVVERGVTLAPDVVAARETLDNVGAISAGVIIVEPAAGRRTSVEPGGTAPGEAVAAGPATATSGPPPAAPAGATTMWRTTRAPSAPAPPASAQAAIGRTGYDESASASLSTVRLMRKGTAANGTGASAPTSNGPTVNGAASFAVAHGATANGAPQDHSVASGAATVVNGIAEDETATDRTGADETATNETGTTETATNKTGKDEAAAPGSVANGPAPGPVDDVPAKGPVANGSDLAPSQHPQPVDATPASGSSAR